MSEVEEDNKIKRAQVNKSGGAAVTRFPNAVYFEGRFRAEKG
jgi:hypothetical protein